MIRLLFITVNHHIICTFSRESSELDIDPKLTHDTIILLLYDLHLKKNMAGVGRLTPKKTIRGSGT